ncbi:MAG TPA: UDP-N-acetylmuramoyl-L-alanine--D-glutamate ligase, partial [Oceanospirillales bacterium]|nr:UDP-N-acetylmuramoyl-L-alanine--D-glutamate ligase [Oceanospirillales bacterium]
MKLSELKQKKIALWGFAVEGKATAQYLDKHGIAFTVLCPESEKPAEFPCICDSVDTALLNRFEVIIKSPGISAYDECLKSSNAIFTSATAIWFANEKQTKVIAVTGTKGKSTTSSLVAHVLKNSGKTVNLVGNIGKPLILSSSDYDYIVMEVSSFQAFDGNIQADYAIVLNLFAEHLDWHHGKENYFSDKLKLLQNATIKIINKKNKTLLNLVQQNFSNQDVLYFNDDKTYKIMADCIYFNAKKILCLSEIQLLGKHNLENILAVLKICDVLNIALNSTLKAIKSFNPLPHRLQKLGKIGKHFAINDSIATTPMATIAALKTVDLAITTLIIGGYDRGHDWCDFVRQLCEIKPFLIIIAGANSKKLTPLFAKSTQAVAYLQADD